jgi:hypothetical protein
VRAAFALVVILAGCGGDDDGGAGPGDDGGARDDGGGSSADGGGGPPPSSCDPAEPTGEVFHVAPAGGGGDDGSGDGSAGAPWATIGHAITQVADGSTILVAPGTYAGQIDLDESFAEGVVIRAEVPYQARLRHSGTVVRVFTGQGITLEGFDIAHDGPGAGALVIQIQDLRGEPGGDDKVSRIVIRNNVLHDSYDNDILKINNGAGDVLVERNVFYNQFGSDEHIDVNSVTGVVVQDNVFFNDFEGSGRADPGDTSSFIVIKDSNGTDDLVLGSKDITVRRNVFLHWQGSTGSNFVLIGEDGTANFEAEGVTVENNLMLGDSASTMRAAFGVKGSKDVLFRNNTVSGDLPSLAYALRVNREGENQPAEGVRFFNNVWADPAGSMEDFSDTPMGDVASFEIDNNLMWNGGAALPEDAAETINPSDDAAAVTGDPLLPALAGLALPRWDPDAAGFADGSATTCEVHARLVERGTPAGGSPALGAADPATAPADDILGRPRPAAPSIGAVDPP